MHRFKFDLIKSLIDGIHLANFQWEQATVLQYGLYSIYYLVYTIWLYRFSSTHSHWMVIQSVIVQRTCLSQTEEGVANPMKYRDFKSGQEAGYCSRVHLVRRMTAAIFEILNIVYNYKERNNINIIFIYYFYRIMLWSAPTKAHLFSICNHLRNRLAYYRNIYFFFLRKRNYF